MKYRDKNGCNGTEREKRSAVGTAASAKNRTKTAPNVKIKRLSKIAAASTFGNVGTFAGETAEETGISPIFPLFINVLYPNGTRGASGRTKNSTLKRNLTGDEARILTANVAVDGASFERAGAANRPTRQAKLRIDRGRASPIGRRVERNSDATKRAPPISATRRAKLRFDRAAR